MQKGSQLCFEDSQERCVAPFLFWRKGKNIYCHFCVEDRPTDQGIEAPSRSLKTYVTKVVPFGMLMDKIESKDKIMQSFGHKMVMLSQFKLGIYLESFFNKSC